MLIWDSEKLAVGEAMLDRSRERIIDYFAELRQHYVKGANNSSLHHKMSTIVAELKSYWAVEEMVLSGEDRICDKIEQHVEEHRKISETLDEIVRRGVDALTPGHIRRFLSHGDHDLFDHFSNSDQCCRENLTYFELADA